ncbi:MAG: hypothetical protein WCD37_15600 [Chloroflexia bacterium]
MKPRVLNRCRVCGLEQEEPPWGDDGLTPSFDLCACCGVEFGYEDSTPQSTRKYRSEWIANGARWFAHKFKPQDWNLEGQLQHIPAEYR